MSLWETGSLRTAKYMETPGETTNIKNVGKKTLERHCNEMG